MFIPGPPVTPLVVFQNLDKYLSDLEGIEPVSGGVGVYGPAAAYALVWELGSLRIKNPGPKTMRGINRDGEQRIFSTQAPGGYVGILEDSFWPIIQEELNKVDFSKGNIQLRFEVAIDNASQAIANLVREWAPVDTGELRSDIQSVNSDEASFLATASGLESDNILLL